MKPSDILRKYGWIQWYRGNKAIGFCLVGAIMEAYEGMDSRKQVIHHLHTLIHEEITDWNDTEGRTKRQVLALLRKAGL